MADVAVLELSRIEHIAPLRFQVDFALCGRQLLPDIGEKMLAQELKSLADADLLTHRNYGQVPPRVDYQLTPRGELALPVLEALLTFGVAYAKESQRPT